MDTLFSPAFVVRVRQGQDALRHGAPAFRSNLLFFERALPTALVPNRDIGMQVLGELRGGVISYAAGVMNGVPDGGSADLDTNDGKDLSDASGPAVRPLANGPLSGLGLAIAGLHGEPVGARWPRSQDASLAQNFLTYAARRPTAG